jgi:multidrug efflux system membrane fusion protein
MAEPPPVIGPDHQLPAHVPERPRRHFVKGALLTLVVLISAAASVLTVHHYQEPKKGPPPAAKITLTASAARKGDIGIYLEAIGTVTPVYTASITSQVNGLIVAVHYEEGQRVKGRSAD